MTNFNIHKDMLLKVAKALGEELLDHVAFVGGSTTGLLITDPMTRESVRHTDDVDLIINVVGYTGWNRFVEKLRDHGFKESMEDEVNCRLRLGELKVDFMPDDNDALGFTNRWYKDALSTAQKYQLDSNTSIRLLTAPYFIATKLEAYKGRGNNDLLVSTDIEDILNLIDGREELIDELSASPAEVCNYVASFISIILSDENIDYAVQSSVKGDIGRQQLLFERMESISRLVSE